jgi:hypothetical protein
VESCSICIDQSGQRIVHPSKKKKKISQANHLILSVKYQPVHQIDELGGRSIRASTGKETFIG